MVTLAVKCQADFSGTTFGGAPTWTDISRFVRVTSPPSAPKWRTDQQGQINPTVLSGLVLDNADLLGDPVAPNAGRFTPDLATSPWYPNVVEDVRIRYGWTIGGVDYWRFDGYIDEYVASADDKDFPTVTVQATDIYGRFGTLQELRSMLQETILLDGPRIYLPLTDDATAGTPTVVVNDSSTLPALMVASKNGAGTATFAAAPGPVAEGTSALVLTQPSSSRGTVVNVPCSIHFAAGFPGRGITLRVNWTGTTITGAFLAVLGSPAGRNVRIELDGAGHASAWAGSSIHATTTTVINDGKPHDIVADLTWNGVGTSYTLTLYVDGVNAGSAIGGMLDTDYSYFEVGGQVDSFSNGPVTSGTYSHAAVYTKPNGATPAVNVTNHYHAGVDGFAGEATDVHYARLLSFRANLGSTIDTGKGTVGLHQIAGLTLQQALLDTAKAEGGLTFADPASGRMVFYNRGRLRDPAVAVTLDCAAGSVAADVAARRDRQLLVNDATISRPNGSDQRATTGTLPVAATSDTLIVNSDADARNAAGWIVANGKTVKARLPQVTFDLRTEPDANVALAVAVLGLGPWRRISLTNPPTWLLSGDVFVQGLTEQLGEQDATLTFFTGPLPRQTLRIDAAASSYTKLDAGNVVAW